MGEVGKAWGLQKVWTRQQHLSADHCCGGNVVRATAAWTSLSGDSRWEILGQYGRGCAAASGEAEWDTLSLMRQSVESTLPPRPAWRDMLRTRRPGQTQS